MLEILKLFSRNITTKTNMKFNNIGGNIMRKIAKKFLAAVLVLGLLAGLSTISSFASSESGEIHDIAVESSIFKCKFNQDEKTVEILGVEGANYIEIESPSAVENSRLYEVSTISLTIPTYIYGYKVVNIAGVFEDRSPLVIERIKKIKILMNRQLSKNEQKEDQLVGKDADGMLPSDYVQLAEAKNIAKQMKDYIGEDFREDVEEGDNGKYYCLTRLTEGEYFLGTNAYGEYPSQYMNQEYDEDSN